MKKKVVIVGGGFAGFTVALKLPKELFDVVLLDRNNYHSFPPLFYQVATAALEPASVSFPFRKGLHGKPWVSYRMCEATSVDTEKKIVHTPCESFAYDYLVLATGSDTNFFGNRQIEENAIPMKSVGEALGIRNYLLETLEARVIHHDKRQNEDGGKTIIIVGAGPTGVELSGALAQMKNHYFPKDYPELDFSTVRILLIDMGPRVLAAMSEKASAAAELYLRKKGVEIRLGQSVTGYDGACAILSTGEQIKTNTLIWAAGVEGTPLPGIPETAVQRTKRIKTDNFNRIEGCSGVFCIGDASCILSDDFPKGHPQVAQVAIQQGKTLVENLSRLEKGEQPVPFRYKDKGSMATIGRNRAVVDLPRWKFQGRFAWYVWMFIHLITNYGIRNRFNTFVNWAWEYITFDSSLRLIIREKKVKNKKRKP